MTPRTNNNMPVLIGSFCITVAYRPCRATTQNSISLLPAHTYIQIHTYTYTHAYIHTYIQIHIYIHAYIHAYILTYIHTYKYIHTYIHAYIHACIIHTNTYIHTYIHTYMHTYIHTYIHTCMHTYTYIYYIPTFWVFRRCKKSSSFNSTYKESLVKLPNFRTVVGFDIILRV